MIYFLLFINDSHNLRIFNEIFENNFHDWNILLWWPLASSSAFILVYPAISGGVLWVSLKYKKWQTKIKNDIEETDLLTEEKSIELRSNIVLLKHEYFDLIKEKEDETKKTKYTEKSQVEAAEKLYLQYW